MKNIIRSPQSSPIKELLIFISGLLTGAALTCKQSLWEMLDDEVIFNKDTQNSSDKDEQKEGKTKADKDKNE